ncbi:hypothetical protein V8D89_006303 [Ganoderma adspersum]
MSRSPQTYPAAVPSFIHPKTPPQPQPQLAATMPRFATALVFTALSLVLAPLSMAGPIPQTMSSASAISTDVPPVESPTIAFTLGPGSLPHPTASGPAASSSGLALEMDWLS